MICLKLLFQSLVVFGFGTFKNIHGIVQLIHIVENVLSAGLLYARLEASVPIEILACIGGNVHDNAFGFIPFAL